MSTLRLAVPHATCTVGHGKTGKRRPARPPRAHAQKLVLPRYSLYCVPHIAHIDRFRIWVQDLSMGKTSKQLLAKALGGGVAAPAVPASCRRAQELFAQFKKGKKRAKALEEAETMYAASGNSALCIALAKMHTTLAVEQALKLDDDVAREVAVLGCLHAALQYAVTGATLHRSIQCVVLCVFTLHCCRGRGSAEQKQQRQCWHAQLSEALPSCDRAKWAIVEWMDPRLESHATQDRFGFEWNQRGQHPTVEAWAEAVRDDWAKFMHKARVADTIDFKVLERLPTKNPDSLRELLHEVEQAVDRRLAGNVTPLNTLDKEALKQRLDALDSRRAQHTQQPHAAGGSSSSTAGSSAGPAAAASSKASGGATATTMAPPPPQSLTSQWLPALHTAQLNKQRQKAELKRLAEAQMRAQQRAGRLRQYLACKHQGLNSSSEDVARAADIELALSASLPFRHLRSAVHHLAQIKELPASEAELALANLTLLNQLAEASAAATAAATAATADGEAVVVPHSNMPPSVWYGDPLLSTSNSRHCVEGYAEMEQLLVDQQRQDWGMFLYGGQMVCRDVEGWQAMVNALAEKPTLQQTPSPNLVLDRFLPDPSAVQARVYPADIALINACSGSGRSDGEVASPSDDDAFSDALSRQSELGEAEQQAKKKAQEIAPASEPQLEAPQQPRSRVRAGLQAPAVAAPVLSEEGAQAPAAGTPAAAAQQLPQSVHHPSQHRGLSLPGHDGEDLQRRFAQHHAQEWFPRIAVAKGYTQEQVKQWSGEGSDAAAPEQKQEREFLERMADAARHAWLKSVVDAQLASGELPPETAGTLQQMRAELWQADIRQKECELLPLRKKRQRGHEEVAPAAAPPCSPLGSDSDGCSISSGISWRSGSTGASVPHLGGSMAAADILDSYMRELMHNTLPCLDAILGLYNDAQIECEARLLPEDRLGEVRVEQMVRKGFAGHCMVQLMYALHLGQASRATMSATMAQLGEILHGGAHPNDLIWHFVTNERAAAESEAAYRNLVDLEQRSQGRVMSRPISACTRMLAPLLLQEWQTSSLEAEEFLGRCKRHLARMTLAALRHLHLRGRLMEGVLWQLNSYILNCLEKARETVTDYAQQEELSKICDVLADVAHDNQDCFNYVAYLQLRMMLPLYTFVSLLCAEAFSTAADISPVLEDIEVAEASVARLAKKNDGLQLTPAAVETFIEAAAEAQLAAEAAQLEVAPLRRGQVGRAAVPPAADEADIDRAALLAAFAAGVTEVQQDMVRLQAGGTAGCGSGAVTGALPAAFALNGDAAYTNDRKLAERSRLGQQLHRLLYAEATLAQLFQRCEDISDGLEATSQVLRLMAGGMDEFIAGTLSEPLPAAPPLHVEQQLRDAQFALAASDCAQLALMLANERLRALCYTDTLAALREEQEAAAHQLDPPTLEDGEDPDSIAAAVERFARLHDDMQEESCHDRAALQQLADSLAAPDTIPLLKSVDHENVGIVDSVAIVDSVLQFAQNIGNASQPNLQPAIEQYRAILADKQAEAHERLEQVKAYVVAAGRQLEHQRSQLGVLLEWCRIRQLSLIGQLRSSFCVHSAYDQLADVSIRAAAVMCWETEMQAMQELERQVNLIALQREIEAEAAEVKRRSAKAEKRKAQKSRKQEKLQEKQKQQLQKQKQQQQQQQQRQVNGGNGSAVLGSSGSNSSSDSDADQPQLVLQAHSGQPKVPAAAPSPSPAGGSGTCRAADGKPSAQAAAYQRMLEEFGLDSESAGLAQQLAAKQTPRLATKKGLCQHDKALAAPRAALAPSSAPLTTAYKAPAVVVLATKRPGSASACGDSVSTAAGTGSAAPEAVLAKRAGARELMRVVGYYGDWLCFCGAGNKLWDTCACGQHPPCRDWVRGICKYTDGCRFPHPPFDLPEGTTIPSSERIAKPSADAPLYCKGQVVLPAAGRQSAALVAKAPAVAQRRITPTITSTVPAVPGVIAWQKPLVQATAADAVQQQQQQQQPQATPQLPPTPPPSKQLLQGSNDMPQLPQLHQEQQTEDPLVAAATPDPLAAVAPASSDMPPLAAAAGGGVLGWSPIGSAFELNGSCGSGLAGPASSLTSAGTSRAGTPSLSGTLGDLGRLSAAASVSDMLVYPFPAASSSSSLQNAGLVRRRSDNVISSLAAAPAAGEGPMRRWDQQSGGISAERGPTGDESAFLAQLMQGIDVGAYEHGDADLASLLGPIAADVGGMDLFPAPPVLSVSAASRRSHSALELASRLAARPSPASVGSAVPSRHHLPSLLDGLSLQQAVPGTGRPATHQQQHAPALQQQDSSVLEPLVRCLWQCAAFRHMVLTWPEIVHKSDPVVNALHTTFLAYRDSAAQSGPITTACTAALADMLASHHLFGTGGALGGGAEVLLGVCRRICEVESMRGLIPSGVQRCFGLQITEAVQCNTCEKVTRQAHYTQYFVNVPAAALCAAAAQVRKAQQPPVAGLGQLLRLVEDQTPTTCDVGSGGCGAQNKVLQLLAQLPQVVVCQLSWDAAQVQAQVQATLTAAGEQLNLSHLYLGLNPVSSSYQLAAVLCCGQDQLAGSCYAFLLDPSSGRWMSTRTGSLVPVGSWAAMMRRCEVDRMQPSLLFYVAASHSRAPHTSA
ncbi:Inactive ubiquitin carboxyl-terminal hydrolase 53 [Chlorella vulgaris]